MKTTNLAGRATSRPTKPHHRRRLTPCLVLLAATLHAEPASTYYVNAANRNPVFPYSSWETAATNIQHAIAAGTTPGRLVMVTNGVYASGGVAMAIGTTRIVLTNSVTVRSVNGPGVTVIDGAGTWIRCAYVSNDSTLRGFTLRNGRSGPGGAGVRCEPSGVVMNCVITGNRCVPWSGGGAAGGTLYNCTLTDNYAEAGGGGASGSKLYNCTVTDNSVKKGAGGVSGSTLYNCLVYHNKGPSAPNHDTSTFYSSCTAPLPAGHGNIDADPQLATATRLFPTSPCVGAGSALYATGVDIDGEPWADPPCMGAHELNPKGPLTVSIRADHLSFGIGIAAPLLAECSGAVTALVWDFGDGTVLTNQPFGVRHAWKAPGTYVVKLTGYNDGLPQGLSTTVLMEVIEADHYVNASNPQPVFPYTSWATAATSIQDAIAAATMPGRSVFVTNGVYSIGEVEVDTDYGWTSIRTRNRIALSKSVTVRSVNGPGVTVIDGGGAVRCAYVGDKSILSGFTLTGGKSGEAGGGVWCDISGVVSHCVIAGNSAAWDGAGTYGGTLYNCTVSGNSGGGALGGTLYNCTVTGNTGVGVIGGALYNCIIFNNGTTRPSNYLPDWDRWTGEEIAPVFYYSCTTPLPPGPGNIDADPQLASDAHLFATSPCIGAGSAQFASGVDIDGEPWANPPSMGADEFSVVQAFEPLTVALRSEYTRVGVGVPAPMVAEIDGRATRVFWELGDGRGLTNVLHVRPGWAVPGTYVVLVTAYNDGHTEGVSATVLMEVIEADHYVDASNPNPVFPYTSWETAATNIQDAIAAAAMPGQLVLVTNGVYASGRVGGDALSGWNRIALTNSVMVRSVNGPSVTIIKGGAAAGGRCAYVADNSILSGFTLTKGFVGYGSGGGVFCEDYAIVTNCVITGNSVVLSRGGGGGATGGMLYNCTLTDNAAGVEMGGGGGGASRSRLFNCTLTGNSSNSGGGVKDCILYNCTLVGQVAGGAVSSTLYNCTVTGNSDFGVSGGVLYNCTVTGNSGSGVIGGVLYNCIVYHNGGGANYSPAWDENGQHLMDPVFHYSCTTPLPISGPGNIDADPQLATATHLLNTSPCIGAGSTQYAGGVDIDGDSWGKPPCMGADQVDLEAPPTVAIRTDYLRVGVGFPVTLLAENIGPVSIMVWNFGDGNSLTNQPFGIRHAWQTPGTYVLSLTGYNDNLPGGVSTSLIMEVVEEAYYVNGSNPNPVFPYRSWATAATNIQEGITAGTLPGRVVYVTNGVYASGFTRRVNKWWPDSYLDGLSRIALTNAATVRSVNGPGVTVIEGGVTNDQPVRCAFLPKDAILSGFTLTKGETWDYYGGAGAHCEGSAIVKNCVILGNNAGDYPGGGACGGTLHNCLLTGNVSGNGGGAYLSTLHNCTVTGNSGGGVARGTLYNCTVTGNSDFGVSGGVLHNSIVYYNGAADGPNFVADVVGHVEGDIAVAPVFYYSCTTPLPPGDGNIDADPQFMNAASGDFRLRPGSACIDAGTNLVHRLTTDLAGRPRPLDGNGDGVAAFDMGAYEYFSSLFGPESQLAPAGYQFSILAESGKGLRIERSTDLVNWELWSTITASSNAVPLLDAGAHSLPHQFYRAVGDP